MGEGERLRISGGVQGVGFRPHVWRLAQELGLYGSVCNEGAELVIELWGDATLREQFVERLQLSPPLLSRIRTLQREVITTGVSVTDFSIIENEKGGEGVGLVADAATCASCLNELRDPHNRRYQHPFISCTDCGPRFSIARANPFDRETTSMSAYALCAQCEMEYAQPDSRRFHAQTISCPECGPVLWLSDGEGNAIACDDSITETVRRLQQGMIVAVKGIGGFHLACDAANAQAVGRLRKIKQRPHKPFALMFSDIESINTLAQLSPVERELLATPAAPIMLLPRREEAKVCEEIAPGLSTLGCMLAPSGLHQLLLERMGRPLVMTSANASGEPLLAENHEALAQLGDRVDTFLLHDREIVQRQDDSVLQVFSGQSRMLRRARGYVPQGLSLPEGFAQAQGILAMGAQMKGSFCLLQQGQAIVSPQTGELSGVKSEAVYRSALTDYIRLFGFQPELIAIDAHPGYYASEHGNALAQQHDIHCHEVQHHHAHIAAVMAEYGLARDHSQVLGVALDGLGYGEEGTLWGGEFLLADYRGYRRLGTFDAVAMPGGDVASREPWRNLVSHLHHALGWESVAAQYASLPIIASLQQKPAANLLRMIEQGVNSPLASSCGRLFDAVSAALGLCTERVSYEGQAAMSLQQLAAPYMAETHAYPCTPTQQGELLCLQWGEMWQALLADLQQGETPARIAARFHHTVIEAVSDAAAQLVTRFDGDTVVLSGGAFQNRLLAEGVMARLSSSGIKVLLPSAYPVNDGAISLGQALVAAAQTL